MGRPAGWVRKLTGRGTMRSPGAPSLRSEIERSPWKTKAAVELVTLERVSWFNHQQLLEPIGDAPPVEAEQRYYQQLSAQAAQPVFLTKQPPRNPG